LLFYNSLAHIKTLKTYKGHVRVTSAHKYTKTTVLYTPYSYAYTHYNENENLSFRE